MASYFGEVIEKPSRAFWMDEYDSDDDEDAHSDNLCNGCVQTDFFNFIIEIVYGVNNSC